jgi:hypothetical protein
MKTAKLQRTHGGWLVALLVAVAGCGPATLTPEETADALAVGQAAQELSTVNGISVNGISSNGISSNGISSNGLTQGALDTYDFSSWFDADPVQHDTLMHYLVLCGMDAGQSVTYTAPATGKTYTWAGLLGLTPGWASGRPITETEEQLMTACLEAHANKYGIHVPISVLGRSSLLRAIPYTKEELQTFSRPEACFFGNLFNGEGMFVGSEKRWLDSKESTVRACGLSSGPHDTSSQCAPLIHVGSCTSVCKLHWTGLYYESCTWNGKQYKPLTTRLRPQDVYRCGDGVCQFTEHCGTGHTWDSCRADCGLCPSR